MVTSEENRADELEKLMEQAARIGHDIFYRNKTSGSSANMSFLFEGKVFITKSGSCFGNLTQDSWAVTDLEGHPLNGIKPSKELPLHLAFYNRLNSNVRAVIHTHSFYATLWSCLDHTGKEDNVIPAYTPYLGMKLGRIHLVPYAKPGSEKLFSMFRERFSDDNGYLLAHHGPVVGAKDLDSAFYALEELEESAHIAWELRKEKDISEIESI